MAEKELKSKTKALAVDSARLSEKLATTRINNTYVGQILRSSALVGANYRVACSAKSTRDLIHKLQIVEKKTDETLYFLELLAGFNENQKPKIKNK